LPSELQAAATRAVAGILDDAYDAARRTLVDNLQLLRRIGAYLVTHERIDGDTFDALFDGSLDVPDADDDWRPATSRPRAWASVAQVAQPQPGGAPAAPAADESGALPPQ
jgi:hypothetical protein